MKAKNKKKQIKTVLESAATVSSMKLQYQEVVLEL